MPVKKPEKKSRRFKTKGIMSGIWNWFSKFFPTKDQFLHLPKLLSKSERFLILVLLGIAIISLFAIPVSSYYHFTAVEPDYGGTLTEGMVGAPKYINPLLAQTSDVDRDLSSLIYSGLMKYDEQGNLISSLAQSFDISGDGLTYTFKLRENLKWHDGQILTADDVIFTILTIQNGDYGSFQRISWQGVDVSKTDNQTVIFKLKNKYAQFLGNTTLGILPKHLWENVKPASFGLSELNIKPVGSGPYKFSKIKLDSAGNISDYELTAFNNYYGGKPLISKIIFSFYASEDKMINGFNQNEIQGLSFISPQKINSVRFPGKLDIKELRLPRYFAVFLNQNHSKTLSDKNVRQALNYGTDKQMILNKILSSKGLTVDSPMLPGIIEIADLSTKYGFDIDKAKKLLDDTGWKISLNPSADNPSIREKITPTPAPAKKIKTTPAPTPAPKPEKLEIKLITSNWPELISVANELKTQWETIGVNVNLEILALPELQQAIKDRNYEALLFGEVLGLDPDPFSFWHSSQKRDPGLNLALYDNKDADKLLEDTRQTLDKPARISKYNDFQKLLISDAPAVFLYSPYYLYAQTNEVKGNNIKIISVPSDRFDVINKWYINTKRVFKK